MNAILMDLDENVKNKSLLIVSDNLNLVDTLKDKMKTSNYNVSFLTETNYKVMTNKLALFDLVIFDNRNENNLEKFAKAFEKTNKYKVNLPLIIIDKEIQNDLSLYKSSNVYTVLFEPLNIDVLCTNISLAFSYLSRNRRVELEENYYYDQEREQLFQNNKVIKLTKTERDLVKLLIEHKDTLVTYETIESIVWEDKVFSKYTLRNIVKHIRVKTHLNLIKNASNRGYIVRTI